MPEEATTETHEYTTPDRWIQRKDSKGWRTDATYIGEGAEERALAALEHKREICPQHEFRIAPPRRPQTYEEMVDNRFREKPPPRSDSKWVMGD
jgi:hypothetical protein